MSKYISDQIVNDNKTLVLLAASFQGDRISKQVYKIVDEAFSRLSECIKDDVQVLYIRDIPYLAIDGKYPGGHCFNRHEAMVAIPTWSAKLDTRQLAGAIHHELHHMARWQNVGYGTTLGEAILSEGIATYYEALTSGWTPPWAKATVTDQVRRTALNDWECEDYNHAAWFFKGEHGKWVGYSLGYELAHSLYDSKGFDLKHSVDVGAKDVKANLKKIIQKAN
ncbi:MAG: DUF2268 domain-containing putative Zn-dependent protease [Candidatus Saccharimonadales bacterium]